MFVDAGRPPRRGEPPCQGEASAAHGPLRGIALLGKVVQEPGQPVSVAGIQQVAVLSVGDQDVGGAALPCGDDG